MKGVRGWIVTGTVAALVAAACIALGAAPNAGWAARPKCEQASGKTLVANGRVRAFAQRGLLYACATGSRRMFFLGDNPSGTCESPSCESRGIEQVELAGRYVAYLEGELTRDAGTAAIYLLDTKRARKRRVFSGGSLESREKVTAPALVVTPRGGVAWIAVRELPEATTGPRTTRVFKQNAGASRELLDAVDVGEGAPLEGQGTLGGQGIDLTSLALSEGGRTVYWTNSGQPRTAPIK